MSRTNEQVLLDELIERLHQDQAPTLDDSEFFEVFSVERVLKNSRLSYDEIDDGVVDGGNDGGIDAIYTFVNGQLVDDETDLSQFRANVAVDLVVVQATRSASFSEAKVRSVASSLRDLLALDTTLDSLASTYNEALRSRIEILRRVVIETADRRPSLAISISFCSRAAALHPNTARLTREIESVVGSHFSHADLAVHFNGARELIELDRDRPMDAATLTIVPPHMSAGDVGYVTLVELPRMATFLSLPNGSLRQEIFESNVRDYQGSTEINQGIKESLENPGDEDFWWLNNGVTIVCADARLNGSDFVLTDPQIVNGLQTCRAIHDHFSDDEVAADDERRLLVRIIVPEEEASRTRIIRATNSQNKIPPANLRATESIHRDIEDYLKNRGRFYDRRKNYYKNQGKPRHRIVTIPALAQAMGSIVLQRPNDARARPSTLLTSESYESIFASGHPLATYFNAVRLVERVDEFLKSDSELASNERKDLKYHVAYVVSALAVDDDKPNGTQLANLDVDAVPVEQFSRALGLVREEVEGTREELGDSGLDMDKVAKSRELNDRVVKRMRSEVTTKRRVKSSKRGSAGKRAAKNAAAKTATAKKATAKKATAKKATAKKATAKKATAKKATARKPE